MLKDCYESLNTVLDMIKPKKILYIGKVFGEFFLSSELNNLSSYELEVYIISEPPLRELEKNIDIECLNFEDFKFLFETKDLSIYDFVMVDTVHYIEYLDYILKFIVPKLRMDILIFFHDAYPTGFYQEFIFDIRNEPISWVGKTYISLYNFYINNPNNTFIIDDSYVGYAFIKSGILNVDYDTINYDISQVNIESIYTKEDFLSLITKIE
jgi:hypothetical protein